MRSTQDRLLIYLSIALASFSTLVTSLVGSMYLNVLLLGNNQSNGEVQLLFILGIAGTLTFIFKQASPRRRALIAAVLLVMTFLIMPTHNCGPEC